MNTPLRRVSLAVMLMVVALLGWATYVQVIAADDLRANVNNERVLLDEYARQRGQIAAGNLVLAKSAATDDRYKYQRSYPVNPAAYAPVTGYYSLEQGSTGIERAEDSILNGSDNRMFGRRLLDLMAGRDPRGGSVSTTLNARMQEVAYQQLTAKGFTGAVVAIEPATGKILTMVSTPSYDPNRLAVHDGPKAATAYKELSTAKGQPMLNRAVSVTYPPGSTFKVVVAAAALKQGVRPQDQFTAAPNIALPQSSATLENYNGTPCGPGPVAPLEVAFELSCNTAFAELGMKLGANALTEQARAFGLAPHAGVPFPVADSTLGSLTDSDKAALAQSSIGQRNVAVTPLDNAILAATVANGGTRMVPYLVDKLQGPDLADLSTSRPESAGQAVSPEVASTLTDLMIRSENHSNTGGKIPGIQIASKTGTAEHGSNPRNTPPHTWYIGFAPAKEPKIAIAVIVENGGDRGDAATGASVAAPIGRAVIAAGLRDR